MEEEKRQVGGGETKPVRFRYRSGFRAQEVASLARWVVAGTSGAVVGLAGAGKSNLLQYICMNPQVLRPFQSPPIALVFINLHSLVEQDPATFYRMILRACDHARPNFPEPLQETVISLYREYRSSRDPFLAQSGVYELMQEMQKRQRRLVLVLDQFDVFCQRASLPLINTLRGLRDSFKETLSYLVGMRQEAIYLPQPDSLGELYGLLDTHVCWVGQMTEEDARFVLQGYLLLAREQPSEAEVTELLTLSGRFPSLLKAACYWWLELNKRPSLDEWPDLLLQQPSVRHRLQAIWSGLTQEEQRLLLDVQQQWPATRQDRPQAEATILQRLAAKGMCVADNDGWHINGRLLEKYIVAQAQQGLGRIWQHEETGELYQGNGRLDDLRPLEASLLTFFIRQPYKRHSKTKIVQNTWPDDVQREGVTDESIYQLISGLRRKIEPDPAAPTYIINWRGTPESGYQFFPEGRPG